MQQVFHTKITPLHYIIDGASVPVIVQNSGFKTFPAIKNYMLRRPGVFRPLDLFRFLKIQQKQPCIMLPKKKLLPGVTNATS